MTRHGYTQQALGDCLGVSQRAVGKWLAADSRPGPAVALKLAEQLGVSIDVLTDDELDLPIYTAASRIDEAKAVAEQYPVDQPALRQQAFTAQLERAHHALHLSDAATRLRAEADKLDALAAELRTGQNVSPVVAAKVAEARQLREEREARGCPGQSLYRRPDKAGNE